MAGLESDTIGGFNGLLHKQQKEDGEAFVTTVLFDDHYELLHDRIDIRAIAPITDQDYFVRGCTALLDAIGRTIQKIVNVQKHTVKELQADRVLFVITTDGMENASREYTYDKVKKLIKHQKEKYGWEFLFLGANIDAISTASKFGIDADRAANYHADSEGTQLNYTAICEAVSEIRVSAAPLTSCWKEKIDADYNRRKK